MLSPKKSVFSRLLLFLVVALSTLLVVWMEVVPLWRSGVIDEQGNILFDSRATFYDAGVHLSLIGEMQSRFPPTNFAAGGAPLKNYHFFYDALLAGVEKVTGVSYLDLYYRYAPVVLSIFLSAAIFLTVLAITKNPWAAAFGIFFTVFGTSLGTLTTRGHNNVFMTDQIYDLMVNPQGILSLTVFLALFLLLYSYETFRRRLFLFLFAILLAVSFGIKAHGGVVFAAGAAGAAFWLMWRKKDVASALIIVLGLAVMTIWVMSNLDRTAVGLKFAPFWLLERLMADFERLYNPQFLQTIADARFAGNWLKWGGLYLAAFFIYLVGSLGIRLLALIPVIQNRKKWSELSPSHVFLLAAGLVSFSVPLVFNQGKKPFDIVQFTPYFTLLSGIGFTVFLSGLIKKWKPVFRVVSILFFVLIFLFLDRQELTARWQSDRGFGGQVKKDDYIGIELRGGRIAVIEPVVEAMEFIKTQTPPDSIFLIAPTRINLNTLWFTSFSWRRTVYSGEFFLYQVGVDTAKFEAGLDSIFGRDWTEPNFSYVFLRKGEVAEYGSIVEKYHLQRIFENSAVKIFKRA